MTTEIRIRNQVYYEIEKLYEKCPPNIKPTDEELYLIYEETVERRLALAERKGILIKLEAFNNNEYSPKIYGTKKGESSIVDIQPTLTRQRTDKRHANS